MNTTQNQILDLNVSETHFKNAANRLRNNLKKSGLTIGHAKSLQLLSQSLYAKPYEEIKETLLIQKNKNNSEKSTEHSVQIFKNGLDGEAFLFFDGGFIDATYLNLSTEISFEALKARADDIAKLHSTTVSVIDLTNNVDTHGINSELIIDYIESDEFDYVDVQTVFNLGNAVQSDDFSLIRAIESSEVIKIDDAVVSYKLNDDYVGNVFNEEGVDYDFCIWYPENENFEGFFSLRELMNARYVQDNEWIVTQNNGENNFLIKIY